MKISGCLVLFILLGVAANAQQAPAPPPAPKILTKTLFVSEDIVKGSPFSADAINESVQVLADGNRIVRSSSNKLYRNSEGRFRREISGGSSGSMGFSYSVGPGITILDPVGNVRYMLDSNAKTARVGKFMAPQARAAYEADKLVVEERRQVEMRSAAPVLPGEERTIEEMREVEIGVAAAPKVRVYGDAVKAYSETITATPGAPFVFSYAGKSKYETRTEDLGVQNIEGVAAIGTRTITTIPAGEIGNERPIEMVYEKWYSNDLQLVVMSKHSDPRFGEQTYRLTNIVRSEPDPSLFELPQGYRVLAEPAGSYRITTVNGKDGTHKVWVRSSSDSGGSTNVRAKKP
ncbi:MAG: hypothetical protein AB7F88_11630 [Pyrinomonadaceae bacterium]